MKAQFIAIGDELLSGRTADCNGNWLANFLTPRGINLEKMIIVPDDQDKIIEQLRSSWKESDLLIISGGLGPTKDDITKATIAKFLKKKIVASEEANHIANQNYKSLSIPYDSQNNGYHLIPQECEPLPNPTGCAPGLLYFERGKALLSAPGVPREFITMIEKSGWPRIEQNLSLPQNVGEHITIRTYGIPEESIFFKLDTELWQKLEKFGKVSSLPGSFAVDIIVKLGPKSDRQKLIQMVESSALAPYIWQIGEKSLPEYIVGQAKQKGIKIGCAESCTGGLVSSNITDISGSSSVFMGSVISYSNEAKADLLAVPVDLITTHGAVSTEVAKSMAEGARTRLKCDIAISLTGIAGPKGGSPEKPVGTVAIGFATSKDSGSELFNFHGDRIKLKERFAREAQFKLLELLRAF